MTLGPLEVSDGEAPEASPAAALAPYLRAIRAHLLLVVAIVVACVAGSLAWIEHRTTSFEAQAQILVTPVGPNDETFAGLPLLKAVGPEPTQVVNTAASIINSPAAAGATGHSVGQGYDRGSVSSAVTVAPQPGTNVVNVTAQAPSAALAAELANHYARAALEVRGRQLRPLIEQAITSTKRELSTVTGQATGTIGTLRARLNALRSIRDGADPTLSLAHPATTPSAPLGTPAVVLVSIAFLAGLAIAGAAAVLIELLVSRPISEETGVLDAYPMPVLARVPEAPRGRRALAGAAPAVTEAFRSLRGQLEMRAERRRRGSQGDGEGALAPTVLFTSGSPADGRTTAAVELAYAVTRTGYTAIVIDLDVRSPGVATFVGIDPAVDLTALLRPGTALADVLVSSPEFPRLSILAAPSASDIDTVELVSLYAPEIVAEARTQADWVIVDAPPLGEVGDVLNLVGTIEHLVLVSRLGNTSARGLARCRELLEWLGWKPDGHLVIGGRANARAEYFQPDRSEAGLAALPTRVDGPRV